MNKPRVTYSAFLASQQDAWSRAFERVKALGVGEELKGHKILWIHEDPDWVQVRDKDGKRMIRRGDALLIDLTV